MELSEGVVQAPAEHRSVVVALRLKPTTVAAIDELAGRERRRRADMIRVLIEDGWRARTNRDVED